MPPCKRKKHMAGLAEKKRQRTDEERDEDFRPDDDGIALADDAETLLEGNDMQAVGDAATRQGAALRQRLCRERLRGIGQQAQAMGA
jgi:hypothetical protein